MATRFLELKGGIFIEVGGPGDRREEMHSSNTDQVATTMDMVGKMLSRLLTPIGESLADVRSALRVPVKLDEAEIDLGLSFSAEGSIFVAKSKAEGTLSIKVKFKPDAAGAAAS